MHPVPHIHLSVAAASADLLAVIVLQTGTVQMACAVVFGWLTGGKPIASYAFRKCWAPCNARRMYTTRRALALYLDRGAIEYRFGCGQSPPRQLITHGR